MSLFDSAAAKAFSDINPATAERQKYEKILEQLESRMHFRNDLDDLRIQTMKEYEIMEAYPEAAEGHLNDILYEKEDLNKQDVCSMFQELMDMGEEIYKQQEEVRRIYQYWVEEEQRIWQQMAEEQAQGQTEEKTDEHYYG